MLNKIKGCLFGGAIGDALGYAVEFYDEIECGDLFEGNDKREEIMIFQISDGVAY